MTDFYKFFSEGAQGYGSHRPMLLCALEATTANIVELGCGGTSTPYLRKYAIEKGRSFYSYDTSADFAQANKSTHVLSYDDVPLEPCDVLLIDHAPAERRQVDIRRFSALASILVVHDANKACYRYDFTSFRFCVFDRETQKDRHTAMLSYQKDVCALWKSYTR